MQRGQNWEWSSKWVVTSTSTYPHSVINSPYGTSWNEADEGLRLQGCNVARLQHYNIAMLQCCKHQNISENTSWVNLSTAENRLYNP